VTDGADELAAAGYSWEMQDAPLLHRDLSLVDLAHVSELERIGAIPPEVARELRRALVVLVDSEPSAVDYDPMLGEPYLAREHHLGQLVGESVGWLRAGRTRREAVRTAQRMVVRRQVLDLVRAGCQAVVAFSQQGRAHAATVAPDHTYLQGAEPTSFGHYLLGFADPVLRDLARLRSEFGHLNLAPTGSGAVAGSALVHERDRVARDLGFDAATPHIRDGMWQFDPQAHAVLAATTLVLGLDRLAEDLEILTSEEFGLVSLADGLVRPSVLMPQKRNPYALTVIRGSAGVLVGRATGQLALAKSPSARSDAAIYSYGEVPRALELATRVTRLAAAVLRGLAVDAEAMRRSASRHSLQATSLATAIMGADGVDYRTAHDHVREALRAAGGRDLRLDDLVGVRPTTLTPDAFSAALDPARTVEARAVPGGSARASVLAEADRVEAVARETEAWVDDVARAVTGAEDRLVETARVAVLEGEQG